jgi:hypothetical protein
MHAVAASMVKLDRGAEAIPILDECVRRATGKAVHPRLIEWSMDLRLHHFAKCKDAAGCRETAAMWDKLNRTDADSLYLTACMRVVTAAILRETATASDTEADALDDAALTFLQKAVAAGYKDVEQLKKDKDFDALRARDAFTKLVAGLDAARQQSLPAPAKP